MEELSIKEKLSRKLELWQKKLLDLGKRNPNLNYIFNQSSAIELTYPTASDLWQKLVSKKQTLSFGVLRKKKLKDGEFSSADESIQNSSQEEDPFARFLFTTSDEPQSSGSRKISSNTETTSQREPWENADIKTAQSPAIQIKILRNLAKKAKSFHEEQGVNVLYVSFGFLRYTDDEEGKHGEYLAPLLLVPVTLTSTSISDEYKLKLHEDEIVLNPTLCYYLEEVKKISLPKYKEETFNYNKFFAELSRYIQDEVEWQIVDKVGLSLLHFTKISMYKDLAKNKDRILNHKLMAVIAGEPQTDDLPSLPNFGTCRLDDFDLLKPENCFQVVDADSSQQEAIACAKAGVSFILQGPPGTGKSQTITNIIAESLAAGKKVLFVAEKMAALDVVYKRLTEATIGDFCLVLHGNKASRRAVLDQFENTRRLAEKTVSIVPEANLTLDQVETKRTELNDYAIALNTPRLALEKSIYEIQGRLACLAAAQDLSFTVSDIESIDQLKLAQIHDNLKLLQGIMERSEEKILLNPWIHTTLTKISYQIEQDIKIHFQRSCDALQVLTELAQIAQEKLGYKLSTSICGIEEATQVLKIASKAENVPVSWICDDSLEPFEAEIISCQNKQTNIKEKLELIHTLEQELLEMDKNFRFSISQDLTISANITEHLSYIASMKRTHQVYRKLQQDKLSRLKEIIVSLGEQSTSYKQKRNEILQHYEKGIFTIDIEGMYHRCKVDYTWWGVFNKLKSNYRKDCDSIRGYSREVDRKVDRDVMLELLGRLRVLKEIEGSFTLLDSSLKPYFGDLYERENTDTARLLTYIEAYGLVLELEEQLRVVGDLVAEQEKQEDELRKRYEHLYKGLNTDWARVRTALEWALSFKAALKDKEVNRNFVERVCGRNITTACADMAQELNKWLAANQEDLQDIFALFTDSDALERQEAIEVKERFSKCLVAIPRLEDWLSYLEIKQKYAQWGIASLLPCVEAGDIVSADLIAAFDKRFYYLWLDAALEDEKEEAIQHEKKEVVGNFRREKQDNTISEFKKLDKDQFAIAKARLRSMLINGLPSLKSSPNTRSEQAILARELKKKRGIMPVRVLFSKVPNMVLALKPCLMMSPLTVSQYLEAEEFFAFDVIIFDEASQICTENAIGTIMRGKQVIIAGDNKQLPPTNFFQASIDGSDEYNEDDEIKNDVYESLLDEAAILPVQKLLWHYRSRCEELIAFSNDKFYKRELITFPHNVVSHWDIGVKYIYVSDGTYDRGGRNGNAVEAKRVAELVFEHFANCKAGVFNRSLGVIAFGEAQAQAIEAALRLKRRYDTSYEEYFSEERESPFFIKSLENVQGDERDTIIFSIGFAKDNMGKMSMLFGPLSQTGGERRLNVAITRARYNVKLVGSIWPTDIDTSKITFDGPKLLQSYISYAQSSDKEKYLRAETYEDPNANCESPFEQAVYDFLVARGYQVGKQIGCSNYRIDLAVKHPDYDNIYVLGIECDGASYHSARTARERDRLRQEILEGLGWRIYRIWSTSWIKDPAREGERLLRAIEVAQREYGIYPVAKAQEEQESTASFMTEETKEEAEQDPDNPYNFAPYPSLEYQGEGDITSIPYIRAKIKYLVDTAYPISLEDVCRQLLSNYGRTSVNSKFKEEVKAVIMLMYTEIELESDDFLYPKDYAAIPVRLAAERKIKSISKAELAAGMLLVAQGQIGSKPDGLKKETARAFGYKSSGKIIKQDMDAAYQQLLEEGKLKEENGKVVVCNTGE